MRNVERLQNSLEREDVINSVTGIAIETTPTDDQSSLMEESSEAFHRLTQLCQEQNQLQAPEEEVEEYVVLWNEDDGEEQELEF